LSQTLSITINGEAVQVRAGKSVAAAILLMIAVILSAAKDLVFHSQTLPQEQPNAVR
jgi:hypothetical protein